MKLFRYIVLLFIASGYLFASVGTITALKGNATISRETKVLTAKTGFKIEEKDIIKTSLDTKMQIIFNDETIITLGKNTTFSVNKYLFENDVKPIANFGLFKGAMRTITGKIGKIAPDRFKVKTNTASIGIRGTNFTITIMPNGSQKVFCTFGAISVKIKNKSFIVKQGFKIDITPKGKAKVKKFTPNELKKVNKESLNEKKSSKKATKDISKITIPTSTPIKTEIAETEKLQTITNPIQTTPLNIEPKLDIIVSDVSQEVQNITEQKKENDIDEEEAARIAAEEEAARIAAEEEAARIAAEEEAARIAAEEEAARIAAEEEAARIAAEEEAARIAAEEEAARIAAEEEAARIAAEEEAARIAAEEEAAAAVPPPPPPPPPAPEPEPEPEPVIINTLSSGNGANPIQSIDEYANYILPNIQLDITTTDGVASFNTANSYVKESSYDSTSNTIDWQYNLAQTPTNYTSIDNFQTVFDSVMVSDNGNYTNLRIKDGGVNIFETQSNNTNFTSSSFTSWGRWELDLLYDDTYNSTTDNEIKSFGYWISGVEIDPSIISAITSSDFSAIYDGQFIGYYFDTNGLAIDTNGDATLNMNYATNDGNLILQNFMMDDKDKSIPVTVIDSKLVNSKFGYLNASYYGDGTNVAGSFKLIDEQDMISIGNGIFDVTQSAYELPLKLNGLSLSNITADKTQKWYEYINIDVLQSANKISFLELNDNTDSSGFFRYSGLNLSSFTSPYEFSGEFIFANTEVESITPNSSSIVTTPTPNGNNMSWGEWNINITYNNDNDNRVIEKGLFVAGEITPPNIIELAHNNKSFFSYSGTYKAIDLSDNSILTGDAMLDINFAFDSAELTLEAPNSGLFSTTYFDAKSIMDDMANFGEFHASQRDNINGNMSGKFYGLDGLSVGGAFTLYNQDTLISKGIYEVGNGTLQNTKLYLGGGAGIYGVNDISMSIEDINQGSKFYTQNSYLEEKDDINTWRYNIQTPTTYNSISDFTSNFSSIDVVDDGGYTISNISKPSSNNFNATNDDLDANDEMSWGEWDIAFTYDQETISTDISQDISGLWVSGVETNPSVISGYTMDGIVYDGIYKAIDFTNNNAIVNGVSRLDVDFGEDKATLTIRNTADDANWAVFDIAGIKANASLDGVQQNNDGITRGHFVGATANDAAGDFSIYDSGEVTAKGIYQVHTNTNLSGN